MASSAASLGRTSPRPTPRGGTRPTARSPRPSRAAQQKLRVAPKQQASTRRRVSARQRRRLLVTMCTTITVALAFGVAISQVIVAQNQDRLDKLNHRVSAAQQRYEKLRYQVAQLESPERIVAAAHNRLGMVEPDHVTYVPPVVNEPVESTDYSTDASDYRLVKAELAQK